MSVFKAYDMGLLEKAQDAKSFAELKGRSKAFWITNNVHIFMFAVAFAIVVIALLCLWFFDPYR